MDGINADGLRNAISKLLEVCEAVTTYDLDVTGVATDLTPMLRWGIDRIDNATKGR